MAITVYILDRKSTTRGTAPRPVPCRMEKISKKDIIDMIQHWLATPPNGYLGDGYGADLKSLLQSPMSYGIADGLLAKMRIDIPLVAALPSSALNVYAVDEGPDKRNIYIDVAGETILLGSTQ